MYIYRAKVGRVVDGDTIDLEWIDKGFGEKQFAVGKQPLRLRLFGVNTKETIRRKGTTEADVALGLQAREWMKQVIEGQTVKIKTVKGGQSDHFGRFLVWIWLDGPDDEPLLDSGSLNEELLRRGLAERFIG